MGADQESVSSAQDLKAAVLRRVIVLDSIGQKLTIPALVRELIDDMNLDMPGLAFESAVRDLDRDGLLSCKHGVVSPTPYGFQARGETPTAHCGIASQSLAGTVPLSGQRGSR